MRTIKHPLIFLFSCFLFLPILLCSQADKIYTPRNFLTLYDEFEYRRDLMRFLDIQKGDVVADVGGGNGCHSAALSLLYDSVTFYVEDITPKVLSKRKLKQQVSKYSRKRQSPQTNTFHCTLGTYTATNLPDGIFDKIFMVASFHEFTEMDAMIADLAKKLKPHGKIYILEAFSSMEKTIYCEDHHKGYRIDEAVAIMKKQGFYLTKMKSPESNIVDYTNCLAFEKGKRASDLFYASKEDTDLLLQKCFMLGQPAYASDSLQVMQLADLLAEKISVLTDIYIAYECWLKNIGLRYAEQKNYPAAINILKACIRLFPESPKNYSHLGDVYASIGQAALSDFYLQKAGSLETTSSSR